MNPESKIKGKKTTKDRYIEAVGGRKTAVARVRLYDKKGGILVNEKNYKDYFSLPKHQQLVLAPLALTQFLDKVSATVRVRGSGINAQAEAVRHGLARALAALNVGLRPALKQAGFLTRDSRQVERKKYGLKKARRAPQWQKR